MHILHVVGARPNFIKAAPVLRALAARPAMQRTLVHTGQHYDSNMSGVFFEQLGMPAPDVNLEVGPGSHAQQTAQIMSKFEPVVLERKPDIVLVYGDVNSTVAAALVCAKLMVRVAHVEAGLRSFDRTMPEEINRVVTDRLSDLLFTPSTDGDENLLREGVDRSSIYFVGNVMIDTLVRMLPAALQRIPAGLPKNYVLVTLHRPANVDDLTWLFNMLNTLAEIGDDMAVLFPVHPRTRQRLAEMKPDRVNGDRLRLMEPLPYLEFLALQARATMVITDSGGIQEETTFLGVPCLTVRDNTERPVTISVGTNRLVGRDRERIREGVKAVLGPGWKKGSVPDLWDGQAAERIAAILEKC